MRLKWAGRAYELSSLTRNSDEEKYHDENPFCDFCSTRKPRAQVGTIRGVNRCHGCEAEDPEGWHNETNSQYENSQQGVNHVSR